METTEMTVRLQHEAHTDVMYADLCTPADDADIVLFDIGGALGFPMGQVLARLDKKNGVLIGLTIQEFRSFRRRILWKYRMTSVNKAIQFLADALRMGVEIAVPNRAGACAVIL